MAKEEKRKPDSEVSGDSSHLEDHVMKTAAQFFKEDLLPYVGIQGRVVGIAPTEQIHLEVKRMEEDFNFIMEDGSWRHLEFESDRITEADLRRFREYDAYIGMAYGVPVVTTVLCSAKASILKHELINGFNHYQVEVIQMKNQDADPLFQEMEEAMRRGDMLTRSQIVPLLLTPLMSGAMSISERICRALELIRSEQADLKREERKRMEAVLYALAIKFLEKEELKQVKERIRMTLLGQMLREDGIEEGMQKGLEKGKWFTLISLVTKKFQNGQSPADIAKDLMEDREMIEKIVETIKSNPKADAEALFHLLKKEE